MPKGELLERSASLVYLHMSRTEFLLKKQRKKKSHLTSQERFISLTLNRENKKL